MKYICTHTDFTVPYKLNGEYTILSTKIPLDNVYPYQIIYPDNELKEMQYNYAEGYMIYDVFKNGNYNTIDEWVAINHYRRYIDYHPETITLPQPFIFNLNQQYGSCHNIKDILEIEQIISDNFPEYKLDYNNINILYPCNMFQLPIEDFNKYVKFVFGVLDIYNEKYKLKTDEDVKKHVTERNTKINFDVNYQSRLQGFLMERIGTIFFLNYIKDKNVEYKPILITTEKIY